MKFQATSLFLVAAASSTSATEFCPNTPVTIINSVADDAAGLTSAFEAFRGLLGGAFNGNTAGPLPDGHRGINWDAPIVPFEMPGDFFAATVTRGLTIKSGNSEFRVSNPPADSGVTDDKFDSINSKASENFQTFSPERLFTPYGERNFYMEFSIPGDVNQKATVAGFGAVFVDVDKAYKTTMTFYAEDGCKVAELDVNPQPGGLTFAGAISGNPSYPIVKVEIELAQNVDSCFKGDKVVLDDFLYSEPQAIA